MTKELFLATIRLLVLFLALSFGKAFADTVTLDTGQAQLMSRRPAASSSECGSDWQQSEVLQYSYGITARDTNGAPIIAYAWDNMVYNDVWASNVVWLGFGPLLLTGTETRTGFFCVRLQDTRAGTFIIEDRVVDTENGFHGSVRVVLYADGRNLADSQWIMWAPNLAMGLSSPEAIIGDDLQNYKAYRWDPDATEDATYKRYVQPSTIQRGRGYWLKSIGAGFVRSGSAALQDTVTLGSSSSLRPGWNMIGNPFHFHIEYDTSVRFGSLDPKSAYELAALDTVTLFWWDEKLGRYAYAPSAQYPRAVLAPARAYWVKAKVQISISFSPNPAYPDTSIPVAQSAPSLAPPFLGGGAAGGPPGMPEAAVQVVTPQACLIGRVAPAESRTTLRTLRDSFLLPTGMGRWFVQWYYDHTKGPLDVDF